VASAEALADLEIESSIEAVENVGETGGDADPDLWPPARSRRISKNGDVDY
jgi:hypothetical protein